MSQWTYPGVNPGVHGERPTTNRLSHGMAGGMLITGTGS
jgi:hypothetical protein